MFSTKKYNFYKMLVLYWAQNPHSKGAYLLYKYVIQKPLIEEEEEEEEEETYKVEEKKESYRIIDGYIPQQQLQQQQSNSISSSDDDSITEEQQDQSIHITLSSQKEVKEKKRKIGTFILI